MLGGGALMLIGGFVAVNAFATLSLGSVSKMGPGMVPAALGCILGFIGLAIFIPSLYRAGSLPSFETRPFVTLLASILSFAIIVRPFGLVPAVVVLTVIASSADSKLSPVGIAALAAVLALLATLIFIIGLEMRLSVFAWPW